ncbi:VOC family protein [Pseudomarimonas arenosa]|uniref:VOC domain-containing protein n=1 Tax=Pseudomarimonas arenosa TaxID=2774145 RepID=A0AAW3ZIQ7_9GAMM|nr:VOC family protein [Pseudomarimonas arenosa]MBD8525883.1 hypothetical protein [Pseudomarimonas arenosa]
MFKVIATVSLLSLASLQASASSAAQACATARVGAALSVADIEQAERFYQAGLNMQRALSRDFPEHGLKMRLLCSATLSLEILQSDKAAPNPRGAFERDLVHGPSKLVVWVEDLQQSSDRLVALGATLNVSAFEEPNLGVRIAILTDPLGNPIQLNQPMPP